MSDDEVKKKEEELKKEEFYKIKNLNDELLYTTTPEELTEVLVGILSTGSYTKTFKLFGGRVELTYTSVTDKERMSAYDLIRLNADANAKTSSQIQLDSYNAKVSIALQLIRIKNNDVTTNLTQGSLEDRVKLLTEMPEEQLKLYNKYLVVFSTITNKAFASEEYLKNS